MLVGALLAPLLLSPGASGQGAEVAGVITEIKVRRGQVEVKSAGASEWRRAGPLLALRSGDTVRATEDASVVILLSGGRGSVKVEAADSPYVMPAPRPETGKVEKAGALLDASLRYVLGSTKESPRAVVLSNRAGANPATIITPRNGWVLPDTLLIEWLGSRLARYTIRIVGPTGVVLERQGVTGSRLDYPPDAPALTGGVRYTLQVLAAGRPPQEGWFEVVNPARSQAIRQEMTELEQEFAPLVPPSSLAVLQAAYLAGQGLAHDARLVLLSAISRDPDEPTLYRLLGNLYMTVGLPVLAAEAYEEARLRLSRGGGN